MAKRLLLGLSLHVQARRRFPRNDSLPGVASTACRPAALTTLTKFFEHLRDYPHDPSHSRRWLDTEGEPTATHPLVSQIATQMLAMEPRVKANIVAEALELI